MESITTHLTSWSWGWTWELDLSKDGPAMHVLLVWDGAGGKGTHNCYLQSTVFFLIVGRRRNRLQYSTVEYSIEYEALRSPSTYCNTWYKYVVGSQLWGKVEVFPAVTALRLTTRGGSGRPQIEECQNNLPFSSHHTRQTYDGA